MAGKRATTRQEQKRDLKSFALDNQLLCVLGLGEEDRCISAGPACKKLPILQEKNMHNYSSNIFSNQNFSKCTNKEEGIQGLSTCVHSPSPEPAPSSLFSQMFWIKPVASDTQAALRKGSHEASNPQACETFLLHSQVWGPGEISLLGVVNGVLIKLGKQISKLPFSVPKKYRKKLSKTCQLNLGLQLICCQNSQ